jgi:regulatory protein
VRRLKTYTDDPEVCAYITDFLTAHNLVDDEKFAKWWITSRSSKRSHRVLAQELKEKGISQDIIDQQLLEAGDELESLQSLLEKKLRSDPNLKDNLPKLYRYFLGKGYTYANIQQVIH